MKIRYLVPALLTSVLVANPNIPIYRFSGDITLSRLNLLKMKGFDPKNIFDIGAFRGEWSSSVSQVFPNAHFYMFEANESHIDYLKQTGFDYFNVLLGNKDDDFVVFFSNNSTGDSILKENTHFYDEGSYSEKLRQMKKLSTVVSENHLPKPDLIKIDVQGAEKLIMEGSKEIINSAEAIILELNILEYNKDAPLLGEMLDFMDDFGFQVVDILEHHYVSTGDLIQIDFLFLKKDSTFIKRGKLG
jgi:FkbM family methyltransferase